VLFRSTGSVYEKSLLVIYALFKKTSTQRVGYPTLCV